MSQFAPVQDLSWCISTNNKRFPQKHLQNFASQALPLRGGQEKLIEMVWNPLPSTRAALRLHLPPAARAPRRRPRFCGVPVTEQGCAPSRRAARLARGGRARPSSRETRGTGRFGAAASVAQRVQHQHLPPDTF